MTRMEARTLLGWLVNGEIVSTFSGTGNLREKQSHSEVNQRADNSQCVYNPKFLHLTLENARKDESSPGTMKTTLTLTRGCQMVGSDWWWVTGAMHPGGTGAGTIWRGTKWTYKPSQHRHAGSKPMERLGENSTYILRNVSRVTQKYNCRDTRVNYFALRQTNRWTDIIDYYCDRFIWEI